MAMGMLTTAAGIGRRRGPIDCPSYSSQGRKLARNAAWPEIWGTADRDLRSRKPGVDSRLCRVSRTPALCPIHARRREVTEKRQGTNFVPSPISAIANAPMPLIRCNHVRLSGVNSWPRLELLGQLENFCQQWRRIAGTITHDDRRCDVRLVKR